MLSDELTKLIPRFKSTRPDIAFLVETHLICLGGVNAIKSIWDSIQNKSVTIHDYGYLGPTGANRDAKKNSYKYTLEIMSY